MKKTHNISEYRKFYSDTFQTIVQTYTPKKLKVPRKEKKRLQKIFAGNIGVKAWGKYHAEQRQFYTNMAPFWQKMYDNFLCIQSFNAAHKRGISPLEKYIPERFNPKK